VSQDRLHPPVQFGGEALLLGSEVDEFHVRTPSSARWWRDGV
jgi:hypothetical protein